MAATKYIILSRFYNSSTNTCVTNEAKEQWVNYKDTATERFFTKEIIQINATNDSSMTAEQQRLIIESNRRGNPKFDMMFCYDGVNMLNDKIPYLIHDMFIRMSIDPWFLNSVHSSLESAMTKAKGIINTIGIDNVVIGKEVPLEQYIEIV